jgi:peroxiredoxin
MRRGTLAAVLAIGLAGCAKVEEESAVKLKDELTRKPAPAFELKDANGATAKLSDYTGKVVLMNFWATWCGPCRVEMPWFSEFEKTYKDRGFAVLGVSLDEEGWKAVKPYLDEHKDISYRMMVATEQMADLYGGIESLPTTFVIDREGRIASVHTGLVSKSTYAKEIEKLLTGGIVQDASLRDAGRLRAGELVVLRPN